MAAPPLNITIAPVQSKGRSGNDFDRYIKAHPALNPYKIAIQQWAGEYGVPALWVAAVIWKESRGQNVAAPRNHGWGVTQINIDSPPTVAQQVLGRPVTERDAMDPATSIQILAASIADANPATLDDFYTGTWNPGFRPSGSSTLPSASLKGYNVTVVGRTPVQKAAGSVAAAQAKQANLPEQQAKLGQQLVTQFNNTKRALDPIYLAYTGKPASPAQVQSYIDNPTSTYQIELGLADPKQNPLIFKSPVWQTNSGRYQSYYQDVFGPKAKVPQQAVLYGVVHSLDETAFKELLKQGQLPGQASYRTSEEYKGLFAQYQSAYANIYGLPDETGKSAISQAVSKGWNLDQWNQYLRKQPEYLNSGEYKQRALDLADRMGLVQGGAGQTAISGPPPQTVSTHTAAGGLG